MPGAARWKTREKQEAQAAMDTAPPPSRGWRARVQELVPVLILGVAALRFAKRYRRAYAPWIRSATADQPLERIERSFFADDAAAALTRCAVAGASSRANELNELFSATRGLVARFNAEGVDAARRHAALGCLLPFFDAVRDPAANAFVLNVLSCDAGTDAPPVAYHIDATVAIDEERYAFAAHSVSVWYASVPRDMAGGALDLVLFDDALFAAAANDARKSRALLAEVDGAPAGVVPLGGSTATVASITPAYNDLVVFRGDAFHRVRPYRAADESGRRVSLVLEQYRVPDGHYAKTEAFHFSGGAY